MNFVCFLDLDLCFFMVQIQVQANGDGLIHSVDEREKKSDGRKSFLLENEREKKSNSIHSELKLKFN